MDIKTKFSIGDKITLVSHGQNSEELVTITGIEMIRISTHSITATYLYESSEGDSGNFELIENGNAEIIPVFAISNSKKN